METTKTGIILAGGKGTRMTQLTKDKIPKSLIKVKNRALLYHTLDNFIDNDVKNIIIAASHLYEHIEEEIIHYRNKADVEVVVEENQLGTAGAIKNAIESLSVDSNFFVTYGDTLTSVNLSKIYEFHKNNCPHGVIMALAPIDDYEKDRIVRLKPDYRISKTIRFPSQKDLNWSAHINKQPLVDAGIYVLNKQSLQLIDQKIFSTDTFLEKLTKKEMLYGFPTEALYFNVGTPEILYTAEQKWQKKRQNLLIPFTSIKQ